MTFILQTFDGEYHTVTVEKESDLEKLSFWDKVSFYTKE